MELLGPSAAGLVMVGIAACSYVLLRAGGVRIPDDPPEVDVELDELYRLRFGDSDGDDYADTEDADGPEPVQLRPVA